MKVLVTGGTGVIGKATVTELLDRGHAVRLFSRGAEEAAGEWSGPVEPFAGDVGDPARVRGAAAGCGAVIHITGIVEEDGDATFERINVEGTRAILDEAVRAGVQRFVFVSSLGAERGESDYHRSKLAAEDIVRQFTGAWTIVRVGAVMGPGDETVSVLLRMLRTLPAVPLIDDGDQSFQPVWHEDVGWGLAECVERDDVAHAVLNFAGPDVVTVNDVLEVFGGTTGRSPIRLPLPAFLAKIGSSIASAVGIDTPVSAGTVQMLLEGSYLRAGEQNDLVQRLGCTPVPTRNRLVELTDALPEQTPDEGVGKLQHRRFHIDIHGSAFDATALMSRFREKFDKLVPFEAAAEPGAPTQIEPGATLTLHLPGRGNVQVRVEQFDDRVVTLATLEGHPLAGVVRFHFADAPHGVVRFTIDAVERPASRIDQVSMALIGNAAQGRTWKRTAENVAEESGGQAPDGVQEESRQLDDEAAEPLEDWVRDVIHRHRRAERDRS